MNGVNGDLTLLGSTLLGTTTGDGSFGSGTVFQIKTNGTGFAVIKEFTGADGSGPTGGLTLSGSVLYGTTSGGGSLSNGVVFALDLSPAVDPQPTNQVAVLNSTATISARASGLSPMAYQWLFNNSNIVNATNSTLTISGVNFTNAGDYQVIVTNIFGSVTGQVASLSVTLPPLTIATTNAGFGVQTNQFGFNINWVSGYTAVVEASSNLIDWQPLQTNTLTTDSDYFGDPQWTNYPSRFYRLRTP